MSEKQPEALRLADWCEANSSGVYRTSAEAAAELRRLHAECEALRVELHQITSYADALNDRCVADAPDAERYRWLRDEECAIDTFTVAYWNAETAEEIDAAIDAARAAKEQP